MVTIKKLKQPECDAAPSDTKAKENMMKHLYSGLQNFLLDEDGTTSIEYGLLGSLIAVVIVLSVHDVGTQVCQRFKLVAEALGATGIADCK